MKRLTKREGKHTIRIGNEWRRHDVGWDKLAEYEDLEEQGLLLRLPLPEGSTVFIIDCCFDCKHNYECPLPYDKYKCEDDIRCEHEYKEYWVKDAKFNHHMMNFIGETVFLTREETEQKLKELKGEN